MVGEAGLRRDQPGVEGMSWAEHPLLAEWSCAKPAEIEHGHVEHLIKYRCDPYYRLRGSGDGKPCDTGTAPREGVCPWLQGQGCPGTGLPPVLDDGGPSPVPRGGMSFPKLPLLPQTAVRYRYLLPPWGYPGVHGHCLVLTPRRQGC